MWTGSPPAGSAFPSCAAATGRADGHAARKDGWLFRRMAESVPFSRSMTDLADTLKEALRMTTTQLPGEVDLSVHGIAASGRVYRNPSTSLLYTHALRRGDGRLAEGGSLVVDTGAFTGRSPKD